MKAKYEYSARWGVVALTSTAMMTFAWASQDLATQHNAYKLYFSETIDPTKFDIYFSSLYSTALFFIIFLDFYIGVLIDKYVILQYI